MTDPTSSTLEKQTEVGSYFVATYPPFSATRVGDKIIGRGSSDAKANVLSLIYAAAAYREAAGGPPVVTTKHNTLE